MMIMRFLIVAAMLCGLSACFGNKNLSYKCDESKRYQEVTAGKRVEPPEGLDPLNEFVEMPIPKPENAPVRPQGSRCIELPPSVLTDS